MSKNLFMTMLPLLVAADSGGASAFPAAAEPAPAPVAAEIDYDKLGEAMARASLKLTAEHAANFSADERAELPRVMPSRHFGERVAVYEAGEPLPRLGFVTREYNLEGHENYIDCWAIRPGGAAVYLTAVAPKDYRPLDD